MAQHLPGMSCRACYPKEACASCDSATEIRRCVESVVTKDMSVVENLSWSSGYEVGDPVVVVPKGLWLLMVGFVGTCWRLPGAKDLINEDSGRLVSELRMARAPGLDQ